MNGAPAGEVTELLHRWKAGESEALDLLMPLVYNELRRIARRHLGREYGENTLQTTELVHEAYLRLTGENCVEWQDKTHFFAVAATVIRHILVDHARGRRRLKRGGDMPRLALTPNVAAAGSRSVDLLALDDTLRELARMDPQQSRIVELRFFAGLTIEATAEALGLSASTVKREWISARTWIFAALQT